MGRYYNGDIEGKFWFGVQNSNAADRFGVTGTQPEELYYYFDEEDLPGIHQELTYIEKKLGNNLALLRNFFEDNPSYENEKVADYLHVDISAIENMLKDYADYELGLKIVESIKTTGQCEFTAEL